MTGYRNGFEAKCGAAFGPAYQYEPIKLTYTTSHTYTPDFVDAANKTIIETKGFFPASDRSKMLAVKRANPDWRIEICFQRPETKISKGSKTTYREWAEKNGFVVRSAPLN
tara:strand:- start:1227 stop:1559 length:333 start_codon:yes stop_codon:yes gene_type:complete